MLSNGPGQRWRNCIADLFGNFNFGAAEPEIVGESH